MHCWTVLHFILFFQKFVCECDCVLLVLFVVLFYIIVNCTFLFLLFISYMYCTALRAVEELGAL